MHTRSMAFFLPTHSVQQTHILHGVFQKTVTRLHTLVTQLQQQQGATSPPLLAELITLVEKILQWQFESTQSAQVLPGTFAKRNDDDEFDRDDGPGAGKKTYTVFPKNWQPLVANTDVIWLFFTVCFFQINDNMVTNLRFRLIHLFKRTIL